MNAPAPEPPTAWVKLYHPRGVDVRLPIHTAGVPVPPATWKAVLASVDAAIDAGFLATAPGLEPGETRETIGAVVQRLHDNRDGGALTPVIDLYAAGDPATNRYKLLSVYLNTEADQEAFERASGLRLDKLPVYEGSGHIERGKDRRLDQKVVAAPKPFAVAWRPNPKHDPAEKDQAKMKPKRLFARWPELPAAAADPVARGREAIAAAATLDGLASVWKALTRAAQVELAAEKDARKAALTAAASPGPGRPAAAPARR
jgi:hypothetical protein